MSYAFCVSVPPTSPLAAGLNGEIRHGTAYRRGDMPCVAFRSVEEPEPTGDDIDEPVSAIRRRLAARIEDTLERYASSGLLTAIELRTIRALWAEGLTLRAVAAAESVSAEAVRARIEGNRKGQGGVRSKASEFYRWWAFKQRHRRKGGR